MTPARKPAKGKQPSPKRAAKAARPGGGDTAARALERAKGAGAIGPFGTDAQRALRDGAIVTALAAGRTIPQVASEFGISKRAVSDVKAKHVAAPSILDTPPMSIVEGFARSMRQRLLDLNAMAYHHADANPPVAVAAQKAAQQVEERLVDLLRDLGTLPSNLSLFRSESVLVQAAEEMADTMMAVRDGRITAGEAWEVFDAMMHGRERPRQIGPGSV